MTGFNSTEGAGMMPFFVPPIGTTGIDRQTATVIYSKFSGQSVEKCADAMERGMKGIYAFDANDALCWSKLMLECYRQGLKF